MERLLNMAKIYIETWETWTTSNCKLIAYDTENIRQSFEEMKDWDDDKIKKYLEDNDGDIEFADGAGGDARLWEVIEDSGDVEFTEYQFEDPTDSGTVVFSSAKDWGLGTRAWWRGSNDLRCEDRSAGFDEIMQNFLNGINPYSFEEIELEDY